MSNNNKKDRKEVAPIRREYSSVDFDSLVDSALGLAKDQEEKMEAEQKHMKAIEQDLISMMHLNQWEEISRYKYEHPHLRVWIDELEFSYWSRKDYINSHRQQ